MKEVLLSKYNNSEYNPGGAVKRLFWYVTNAVFFHSSFLWPNGLKCFLLRLYGAQVGKGVVIKPNVNIKYPWFLSIGNFVWIGEDVWIDNLGGVQIGDNVCVSQGALLLSGNHDYKSVTFDLIVKEIIIESGAWIGAKSTVVQGLTVGSHAVLSVGSVATSNLSPNGIYQGVPAVKVREREID